MAILSYWRERTTIGRAGPAVRLDGVVSLLNRSDSLGQSQARLRASRSPATNP